MNTSYTYTGPNLRKITVGAHNGYFRKNGNLSINYMLKGVEKLNNLKIGDFWDSLGADSP